MVPFNPFAPEPIRSHALALAGPGRMAPYFENCFRRSAFFLATTAVRCFRRPLLFLAGLTIR